MTDSPQNYEKVSIYPLDDDVREQLLSTQIECVFNWSTREGWPMGVIMSCLWKNGRMWLTAGANRHDIILFEPTLDTVAARGLVADIETLHLDRGYDAKRIRQSCDAHGIGDVICGKRRPAGTAAGPLPIPLGMRWPIERTNSWLSNYGQLRRNTDRSIIHRLAQLALAVTLIITAKLIDWRNRWSPDSRPIR